MSPKIRLDLSEVGCDKPGCTHWLSIPQRHHLRHEKTWINQFQRSGPPIGMDIGKSRALVNLLRERYFAFRPQDLGRLCEWHHVEIHQIYRGVILDAQLKFGWKRMAFTWREIIWTMRQCKLAYKKWIKKKTPGLNPVRARKRGDWG